MNKKAQEEIIGFALIIILVAVILLVFLGISLNKTSEEVPSYEVENFIQSFLQYTLECSQEGSFDSVQDLIFDCDLNRNCYSGESSCDVLNSTLKEISEASWDVSEGSLIKGYDLEILSERGEIISFSQGNKTSNSKGASQEFSSRGTLIGTYFTVYA